MNTDYSKAYERIAENIHLQYGRTIKDRQTFLLAWQKYMEKSSVGQDMEWVRKSYAAYNKQHRLEPQQARYVAMGNTVEELVGKAKARELGTTKTTEQVSARQKGRIVKAWRYTITVRGRNYTVYRDSKGRYASIKKTRRRETT